jgi:multimeric flavodoxin WrbA
MIKAIAISGSPRKDGNTEILLKRVSGALEKAGIETEFVSLAGRTIKSCRACGVCRTLGNATCAITGDDFNGIFKSICKSDIIITGTPVHFGSATPDIMALLDRAGYVSRGNGNLLSRKIGGPITVARRAGQNFTYAQLLYWYMINDMIVPGSTYWNIAFAREIGEVENDKEGIGTIDRFAENLIWLAKKIF